MIHIPTGPSILRIVALCTLLVSSYSIGAFAQGRSGAIAGTVVDSSGAILKGAQVSLGTAGISTVSDDQGRFLIRNLAPGSYTLTITYVGFAVLTQTVGIAAQSED